MGQCTDTGLWEDWKRHYIESGINPGRLCKDGIVDHRCYRETTVKVLFVLKEVNDFPGGDLAAFLRKGPKYQMWHTVARWADGIQRGFPAYEQVDKFSTQQEALRRCAAINLKKTSGGASSDMAVINAYALHDRELLLRQILEIQADVIVACGTFNSLAWLLELEFLPDSPMSHAVYDSARTAWVIPWRHPGRVDNRKAYRELKRIVTRIPK